MLNVALALSLSVSLVLVGAPGELLSNPEAKEKLGEAQAAFAEGDFAAAASAIESAYLIEPAPTLLYPWAQAERQQGNCEAAIELYQRFIDTGPDADLAEAAQGNIDRCNEQLEDADLVVVDDDEPEEEPDEEPIEEPIDDSELFGDEAEEEPEPEPEPEPVPVAKTREDDDQPKAKKWYADPAGGVLAGLGIAGVAVGGALLGVSSSTAKKAPDEDSNTGYLDARDRATTFRNGGVAALSIGSTLLLAGIIRYALVAKKNKRATAAIWIDPNGSGGLAWAGRF